MAQPYASLKTGHVAASVVPETAGRLQRQEPFRQRQSGSRSYLKTEFILQYLSERELLQCHISRIRAATSARVEGPGAFAPSPLPPGQA
jgi:hypothetical protein